MECKFFKSNETCAAYKSKKMRQYSSDCEKSICEIAREMDICCHEIVADAKYGSEECNE